MGLMPVTTTLEKKHFLLAGLVIAIPFLILAISQIIAASPPSGQYHPISELWVDEGPNMNSDKITNLLSPIADSDSATKGYVDAAAGAASREYGYDTNDFSLIGDVTLTGLGSGTKTIGTFTKTKLYAILATRQIQLS